MKKIFIFTLLFLTFMPFSIYAADDPDPVTYNILLGVPADDGTTEVTDGDYETYKRLYRNQVISFTFSNPTEILKYIGISGAKGTGNNNVTVRMYNDAGSLILSESLGDSDYVLTEVNKSGVKRITLTGTSGLSSNYRDIYEFEAYSDGRYLPPIKPYNLLGAFRLDHNDIQLVWEGATVNDRYYIYRDGVQIGVTEELYFYDLDIEHNQVYTYEVFAENQNGTSDSVTYEVETTLPPAPVAPYVKATSITHDTARISWSNVFADYDLYLNGEFIETSYRTYHDLRSLKPETIYEFYVIAKDNYGQSTKSEVLYFETAPLPDPPDPVVIDLKVTDIKHSSARLYWSPLNTEKYEIFTTDTDEKIAETTRNFYVMNELNPDTEYSFKLKYIDRFDRELESTPIVFVTAEAPQPPPPREQRPPPPAVSHSDNPDLNKGSDELVRGANDQFSSFLMLIPILITIIILIFGVGWLIKIFKRKMNKAKTGSVSGSTTLKEGKPSHIRATKRTQTVNSGSLSASRKNTSRLLYQRNHTYKNSRRNFNYENYQKRFR